MKLPLVSVVVPIFNVEKYLIQCLESIINQTYDNIEIILVDDGSTDSCYDICEKYKTIDSRVLVIHKENGGLSSARNVGIDSAKGEYITFIDSDDYIDVDFVKCLLDTILLNNADIVECDYIRIKENTNSYFLKTSDKPFFKMYSNINAIQSLYEKDGCTVIAWNKMYKKSLFNNVRYPIGKIHEDVFTTYKLFFNSIKVVKIEKKLYYYRFRKSSLSNRFNRKRLDVLDAYNEIDIFYNENGLSYLQNKNFQRAINVILRFYAETNDKYIKKDLRERFLYFYKKYKDVENYNSLISMRYKLFYHFPLFDSIFIFVIDLIRHE